MRNLLAHCPYIHRKVQTTDTVISGEQTQVHSIQLKHIYFDEIKSDSYLKWATIVDNDNGEIYFGIDIGPTTELDFVSCLHVGQLMTANDEDMLRTSMLDAVDHDDLPTGRLLYPYMFNIDMCDISDARNKLLSVLPTVLKHRYDYCQTPREIATTNLSKVIIGRLKKYGLLEEHEGYYRHTSDTIDNVVKMYAAYEAFSSRVYAAALNDMADEVLDHD